MNVRALWALIVGISVVAIGCGSDTFSGPVDGTDAGSNGAGGSDASGTVSNAGNQKTFALAGTVSGLSGKGLALKNGSETLPIAANGSFAFKTRLADGAGYAITVAGQPSGPTQVCTVTNGSGSASADVTNVAVTCTTSQFKVGGAVTGLKGTGLVLQNNNGDDLPVSADGTFTFPKALDSGAAFSVTVKTQPTGPVQTCQVTGGSGTVGSGDVSNVVVNCATDKFAVGGSVDGLAGGSVVLQNNGGDDITVSANGSFAFPTLIASGGAYAVTVKTQPGNPTQTCTVSSDAGTVTNAAVTSVRVACTTNTYNVGGTVSGLTGTGLVVQNNAGDNLPVNADGKFTFPTPVASGATYAVTVMTQPNGPSQTCTVTADTGIVGSSNVTDVAITCSTNKYTVGGTVIGLAGSGLVLQNNAGDDFAVATDGTFTFATPVLSGSAYSVTVSGQPSNPTQTCDVSAGSGVVGSGNVTTVTVNCATNRYTIGGTISGLAGTVVLQDNAGDDLTISQNGTFAFGKTLPSGSTYDVTVLSQPGTPSQTCVVASGGGTVTSADVDSVTITCTTNSYAIGGTITGLAGGESVVLQDNAGDDLTVSADGTFKFASSVKSGATYDVSVLTNPASPVAQTCSVTNAAGTVGGSDVTNVQIACTTNTYFVGGTVSGLVGSGLVLQDNGSDDVLITQNGTFAFPTKIASNGTFAVTKLTDPTNPWQTCTVANGSGTVTNGDVTGVTVTCTTNTYTVGGSVSGLANGDTLVLKNNGGDDLTVSGNGSFTFPASIASGRNYDVTISSQNGATAQTCDVSSGSGVVGGGNVTTIAIDCTTNSYTIGGTISGLNGTVVLQDNAGNDLTVTQNGTFSFSSPVASGGAYNVTVLTNPASPIAQTCTVTNGSGTVGSANVTAVQVSCATNTYTVGGTISGLGTGDTVVLRDNGSDTLSRNANGSFTFATNVPSGGTYSVAVITNPTSPISQTCTVTNGTGAVTNANVTDVTVTCVTNTFTVGGTLTLSNGGTVVIQNNGGNSTTLSASGTFTFTTSVASGSTYSVTVLTPPSGQTCSVTNGSGTVGNANVTNVTVSCNICGTNDVSYNGHCYYLDGSNGVCDSGYTMASQTVLASIASMFAGKNYKHTISNNCCIENADVVQNYGMTTHCNSNGPFTSSDVAQGGAGCYNINPPIRNTSQLTLCGTP